MNKQKLINKYYKILHSKKVIDYDNFENIIGPVKEVIKILDDEFCHRKKALDEYVNEENELYCNMAKELIKEIRHKYIKRNNVIWISESAMAGFYILRNKEDLYTELKEYIDELEEEENV